MIVSGCNPFNLRIQVLNLNGFTNLVRFGSVSNLIRVLVIISCQNLVSLQLRE